MARRKTPDEIAAERNAEIKEIAEQTYKISKKGLDADCLYQILTMLWALRRARNDGEVPLGYWAKSGYSFTILQVQYEFDNIILDSLTKFFTPNYEDLTLEQRKERKEWVLVELQKDKERNNKPSIS